MTVVLVSLEISLEHKTNTHGVLTCLSHIDWSLQSSSKLDTVGLDWNDLEKWHFHNKFFRVLVVQAILLHAPLGTFNIETLYVATVLRLLLDGSCIAFLSHTSVSDRLVKSPILGTASGLHKSGQVRGWYLETTQPNDLWLFLFDPVLVLVVSFVEVFHPVDEVLLSAWCPSSPNRW